MKMSRLWWISIVGFVLTVCSNTGIAGNQYPEIRSVALSLAQEVDPDGVLTGKTLFYDVLSGEIDVPIPSLNPIQTTFGGVLRHETKSDHLDTHQNRHRRYRQTWSPPGAFLSQHFAYAGKAIEILGAEMIVHSHQGNVYAINGSYYEDISLVTAPQICRFADVYETSLAAVPDAKPLSALNRYERTKIIRSSRIHLVPEGNGRFAVASTIDIPTFHNGQHEVRINATTGELIASWNNAKSFCGDHFTSSDTPYPARQTETDVPAAIAALGAYHSEAIQASEEPQGDLKAQWMPSYNPPMIAYGPGGGCLDGLDFGAIPLEQDPVTLDAVYNDNGDNQNLGTEAGDALRHTRFTVKMIRGLGWGGFSNGHVLKLLVGHSCPNDGHGIATYFREGETSVDAAGDLIWKIPPKAVVVCDSDLPGSASLEVIAHEWGHHLVYETADFDGNLGGQVLHEGFADVIGYGAEWEYHGPYADWTYGEDINLITRRVDDNVFGAIPGDTLTWDERLKYHKDDTTYVDDEHYRGNVLPTAFRLMVEGGHNPVCQAQSLDGCNVSVSGIGNSDALEIFYVALAQYLGPYSDWNDVRVAVLLAARQISSGAKVSQKPMTITPICRACFPACVWDTAKETAAKEAFAAIGYPPGLSSCGTSDS